MATVVVMPKQGQSVESCIIVGWKKAVGDRVTAGEILGEVETDKALLEVECPVSGTLLALFFEVGDEVPVLTNIAVIGEPGEDVDRFRPDGARSSPDVEESRVPSGRESVAEPVGRKAVVATSATATQAQAASQIGISPRARNLAQRQGLDMATVQLQGTGPAGRIIERDVAAVLAEMPKMTPLAKSMVAHGDYRLPPGGSGVSGRVMAGDLTSLSPQPASPEAAAGEDEVTVIPLKGVRNVIATRMLASLQTTAQLTLNASADASAMLAYRQRLKASSEALDLKEVTINGLILFAVSRILPQYPELNARFADNSISQHKNVHLGVAVDTPRGLMVPVIRQANTLSLKQISQEAKRLAAACLQGTILPDELTGGTFTVTNLGVFGIESFTPVLNVPEVGILGVGNINLKPVEVDGEVQFRPHIGLSLTINHQVVDGAPSARFLQAFSQGLTELELLLAL
jgi:pyruvate dehydrogenase E2 component (dihydrolipoamide acetyltransferase)